MMHGHDIRLIVKTMVTMVTKRGQISIPSDIKRRLGVEPGERLVWEPSGEHECRVHRMTEAPVKGAMAMQGFAKRFREVRRTEEWLRELREGEATQGLLTRNGADFRRWFPSLKTVCGKPTPHP